MCIRDRAYQTRQGTTHAVGEVKLEIAAGEFVSIVGPSGCGKSTLLNLSLIHIYGLRHAARVGRQQHVAIGLVAQDRVLGVLALAAQPQPRNFTPGSEVERHVVALHQRTRIDRRQFQDHHLAGGDVYKRQGRC